MRLCLHVNSCSWLAGVGRTSCVMWSFCFIFPPPLLGQVGIKLRNYLTYNNKKPKLSQGSISLLLSFSSTKQPNKHAQDHCVCFNVQPAGSQLALLQMLWTAELMLYVLGSTLPCDCPFGAASSDAVWAGEFSAENAVVKYSLCQRSISPWEVRMKYSYWFPWVWDHVPAKFGYDALNVCLNLRL